MAHIELSERDAGAAREVLAMAVPDQATYVWTLTDEQIAVLDDPDAPQLADQTWLSERLGDPPNVEMFVLAQEVALRGLVASGDVQIAVDGEQITEVTARPQITGSLVLRRLGNAVLRVARVTAETATVAYCYVLDEGQIFEETVDENGMHEFSIYSPDLWGARIADFLDPAEGAGLGEIDEVGSADMFAAEAEERPELGQAVAVSNLTAVLRDQDLPRVATVFSSQAGTYWLREEDQEAQTMRLTGIDRTGLERLAQDLTRRSA